MWSMDFFHHFIDFLRDPRTAISAWIALGLGTAYSLIFLILFIETAVVFMPFLPGDSLLFAVGVFAAGPDASLNIFVLLPIVWIAPIVGDQCNYFIGRFFGERIIASGKLRVMTPARLEKTEQMIKKWGPLAVFLARFFPFIRTFMPFIGGISRMKWSKFTPYSVLGSLCWTTTFLLLGYFFGRIPIVQKHFELIIVLILVISILPSILGLIRSRVRKRTNAPATTSTDAAQAHASSLDNQTIDNQTIDNQVTSNTSPAITNPSNPSDAITDTSITNNSSPISSANNSSTSNSVANKPSHTIDFDSDDIEVTDANRLSPDEIAVLEEEIKEIKLDVIHNEEKDTSRKMNLLQKKDKEISADIKNSSTTRASSSDTKK